jgi:hypothetical protein
MSSRTLVLACALLVISSSAFAAVSASTPPVRVQSPDGIWCGVTNVTTKPIDVVIDLVNESGSVVAGGGTPAHIEPGATAGPAVSSSSINGFVYCRANGVSVKKVHVTTCVVTFQTITNGSGECLSLTTAP